MAAYMIVIAHIKDREKFFEVYAKPNASLITRFGGEYVLRAPGVESIEGPDMTGASAVISVWPDKEAIHRFWNSPEYEKLKAARQPYADVHVMIVEEPK